MNNRVIDGKGKVSKLPAVIIGMLAATFLIMLTVIIVSLAKGYTRRRVLDNSDYISAINRKDYAWVVNDIGRYRFESNDDTDGGRKVSAMADYYGATLMYYAYQDEASGKIYKDAEALRNSSRELLGEYIYVADEIDENVRKARDRSLNAKQ